MSKIIETKTKFYNQTELLNEAQRYGTSKRKLELLYENFKACRKILNIGIGSRMSTVMSALANEVYGIDIYQGSIDRGYEFIENWQTYRDNLPFKIEFDFLKKKNLTPNLKKERFHYYLKEGAPDFKNYFDGALAIELLLHLSYDEAKDMLEYAHSALKKNKKLLLTVYLPSNENSLDNKFVQLTSKHMSREEFIDEKNHVIDIGKVASRLKEVNMYEENEKKFWLDLLTNIKLYTQEEIKSLLDSTGFEVASVDDVTGGGMFPFANRIAYIVKKVM